MIHSVLKLRDSIDEAPEQGTDIELVPTLEYRPKVNLEDNDDLTMTKYTCRETCPEFE